MKYTYHLINKDGGGMYHGFSSNYLEHLFNYLSENKTIEVIDVKEFNHDTHGNIKHITLKAVSELN